MAVFGNVFGGQDAEDAIVVAEYFHFLEPYLDQLYRGKALPSFLEFLERTFPAINENVTNMSYKDKKIYLLDVLKQGDQNFNQQFSSSAANMLVSILFLSHLIGNDLSNEIAEKAKKEFVIINILGKCLLNNTSFNSALLLPVR